MQCTRPEQKDYHKGGQLIPCGYCPACKYNARVGWTFRVTEEAKHQKEAWFITLTYAQETIPLLDTTTGEIVRGMENNRQNMCESLNDGDLITFINSVKKAQAREWKSLQRKDIVKPEIRYYAVGEYGEQFGRPHYHLIVFNLWESLANEIRLEKIWKKGRVETEALSPALIHYATGYIYEKNKYIKERQTKPRMYCSKGIGKQYIERNKKWHKELLNPWIWFNGYKIGMPKYYRDKIFNEEEKEIIIQKMLSHYENNQDELKTSKQYYGERKQSEYSINYRSKKRKL